MGEPIKGKMYSAEEALNFILYENQENTLAADNVGALLDGNQVTTKYSLEESLDRSHSGANINCESNLFQLADVDQMCSETLMLVKDVGDLLCFQNENNVPNLDKMTTRKSINNLSDSNSEDSQNRSSSDEESNSHKVNGEEGEDNREMGSNNIFCGSKFCGFLSNLR